MSSERRRAGRLKAFDGTYQHWGTPSKDPVEKGFRQSIQREELMKVPAHNYPLVAL